MKKVKSSRSKTKKEYSEFTGSSSESEMVQKVVSYSKLNYVYHTSKDDKSRANIVSKSRANIVSKSRANIVSQPEDAVHIIAGYIPRDSSSFVFGYILDTKHEYLDILKKEVLVELESEAELLISPYRTAFDFEKIKKNNSVPCYIVQTLPDRACSLSAPACVATSRDADKPRNAECVEPVFTDDRSMFNSSPNNKFSIKHFGILNAKNSHQSEEPAFRPQSDTDTENCLDGSNTCNFKTKKVSLYPKSRGSAAELTDVDTIYVKATGILSKNKVRKETRHSIMDEASFMGAHNVKNGKVNGVFNFYFDEELETQVKNWLKEREYKDSY